MASIRVHLATKLPNTLKLANEMRSYMFEQECGELRFFTEAQRKHITNTIRIMDKVISKNKTK